MKLVKKYQPTILFISLLFILAIPVLLPLFHKGFFLSDDGEWMVIRFSAFHQAFRDGQFPVRYLTRLNHGFGYPVANFLYPGFMYIAELFKLVGFGFVNSVKIVLGLSIVSSGLWTYLWLRKLFPGFAAFFGALISLYVPYHVYDVYTRGSVGEVLALAVVPFILWQLERNSFFWSSVGIGFLVLSHNTMAVFFVPVILLYLLITIQKKDDRQAVLLRYAGMLLAGIGLAAFFWIPAVFELHYTRFSTVTVSDISHYFASVSMIGIGSLFAFGLSLFLVSKQQKDKKLSRLLLFFTALCALSIFYSSELSSFLWQYLPSSFVQFPFRLLSYLVISVSFIAAYAVHSFTGTSRWIVGSLLVLLFGFSVISYLQPKEYFDKGEGYYATNEDTTTVKNEYMPRWVHTDQSDHIQQLITVSGGNATISQVTDRARDIHFMATSTAASTITIHRLYYPGWLAELDGKPVPINYANEEGSMRISLPAGNSNVHLFFTETPLRLIGDIVSLLTLIWLGVVIFRRRKLWR